MPTYLDNDKFNCCIVLADMLLCLCQLTINQVQIMKAIDIVNSLKTRKGQHVLAVWQRVAKTLKDCPMLITKRTSAWIRAGIEYANLASVQAGIASGERGEVEKIKWAEWIEYPFILRHKQTLAEYVRLYPASFANLATPKVEWSLNGKPASYEDVEPYLLASEKRDVDAQRPACFTLRAEDVVSLAEA